jgi:probable HAF family extracellular repeat protein
MRQLPKLAGGTFCSAQALNNHGDIVGSCDLPNGTAHGVIWSGGHVQDLGTLGDDDSTSTALDINLHGQVVGSSEVTEGKLRAFLWEKGQILDLNRTIPSDSGWLLLAASRINDKGEIAGRGYFKGAIHAFILRPGPLPEGKRNDKCLDLTAESSR